MTKKIIRRIPALAHMARDISTTFPGARLYMVGGAVRDKLLNRPMRDIDAVVVGVDQSALLKFLKQRGSVDEVGKAFGVFKWRSGLTNKKVEMPNIDIALPRTETGWGTGKRKNFTVQSDYTLSIEKDLERRDFTINAIGYDILAHRYCDPFNGRKDITQKVIKAVGNPAIRYAEDYSRILRAIRLALELEFEIDPQTWRAIKQCSPNVRAVTAEIAAEELTRAFSAHPSRALDLLDKSGILKELMPEALELKHCRQSKKWHSEGNVWTHTKLAASYISKIAKRPFDPHLVLSLILHDIGKPKTKKIINREIKFHNHAEVGVEMTSKIISRLKLESAGINKSFVLWLIKNHMMLFSNDPMKLKNTTVEKYFLSDRYPSELLLAMIECDARASIPSNHLLQDNLRSLKIIKKRIQNIKKQPKKSLLNGNEIMKIIGIGQGKQIGQVLENLREAELSHKVRTKIQAKKFIKLLS